MRLPRAVVTHPPPGRGRLLANLAASVHHWQVNGGVSALLPAPRRKFTVPKGDPRERVTNRVPSLGDAAGMTQAGAACSFLGEWLSLPFLFAAPRGFAAFLRFGGLLPGCQARHRPSA